MKIYREVKCSERLPMFSLLEDSCNKYYTIKIKDYYGFTQAMLIDENGSYQWYTNYYCKITKAVEYWLEPIEIELYSEKILPIEDRMEVCIISDDFTYVKKKDYVLAIKALEAAEAEIIQLKEERDYYKQTKS